MATNESRCILAGVCKLAGGVQCNNMCAPFVAMHGTSGANGRVGGARVPKEYRQLTLGNSPAKETQGQLYETLEKYIKTFDRQFTEITSPRDRIKNLYLFSEETGTGKTTTASAILNEWLIAHYVGSVRQGEQPLQMPAYFLDVNELQTLYNEFTRNGIPQDIQERASREYYRRVKYATDAPFAILDDIGVRSATEGFRGDLHSIINARVTSHKPTVYTSNIPMRELASVFDKRLYDRIQDLCIELYFTGRSNRGKRT